MNATSSPDDVDPQKRLLRTRMKTRLGAQAPRLRRQGGQRVAVHLDGLWNRLAERPTPPVVALYAHLPHEMPTDAIEQALRARGLPRALPVLRDGDLAFRLMLAHERMADLPKDRFGIPTPPADHDLISLSSCACVLVPGLAFDESGGRLGYGKGYYDRALRALRVSQATTPAIGLHFDWQQLERVPSTPHDEPVDGLCSPRRGLRFL